MPDTINFKTIAKYIELGKKKSELEFLLSTIKDEHSTKKIEEEISEAKAEIEGVSRILQKLNIDPAMPFQKRLDELNSIIKQHSLDKIVNAMKSKDGNLYDLLLERSRITRNNYNNRENIGKLKILLTRATKEVRAKIMEVIKTGIVSSEVEVSGLGAKELILFERMLLRIGINAAIDGNRMFASVRMLHEKEFNLDGRKVWLGEPNLELLESNEKELKEVSRIIQLRNAERQIKKFNDEEEKTFIELQKNYLKLLKERDELIRPVIEEDLHCSELKM